ncbi:MAG TPA: CsbD family protein [Acidimicrobiales bacterium]|nr:CsbD family protein [Acidimicrobiales bacterium]
MSGKIDKTKGRIKEVVGSVTDNKDLETEGKIDRRAGEAKETISHLASKIEKAAEKAERRAVETINKVKDSSHKK